MRVVRFRDGDRPTNGLLHGGWIAPLTSELAHLPAHELPADVATSDQDRRPVVDAELLAPLRPGKVIGIGLNYHDHAEEQGIDPPKEPLLFAKFPTAVTGPYADVEKPSMTNQLDYEAELGVVIGREARDVTASRALEHVAGYVTVNDLSARDAQFGDGQWVRGKSFDGFAPMGPALVTADEVPDPQDLAVHAYVNGDERQSSNTRRMIFSVAELVEYCARCCTLEPGDVILTGTPGGVGVFRDPPEFLDVGDIVEVEVQGVGRLRNRIVAPR